jgi:hypothetical protein
VYIGFPEHDSRAVSGLPARYSLENQPFGVRVRDPVVLLLATLTLALVGLAASALPARRAATRIDPVIALAD